MKFRNGLNILLSGVILFLLVLSSCKEEDPISDDNGNNPDTTTTNDPDTVDEPFDINDLSDTYGDIYEYQYHDQWGPYNTHDPSIINDGEYFYSFSTDAMYGQDLVRTGVQVRRSKDLVDWEFVGWAFNGAPSEAKNYIMEQGGDPFDGVWAPYIMKYNDQYRLYYSLSSPTSKLSAIGLGTSSSLDGPWKQSGLAVTSDTDIPMTNAIDPSVLVDKDGNYWMYYGSAYDGIYVVELDPSTGLTKKLDDKGKRVAQRGFTGNDINGNIEGPEIIYNPEFDKYYLFISYDWLETKYNVRVARSDSPNGPFYDFDGNDINLEQDNIPMILAPYKFAGHQGWQGTGHCTVFEDDGQFYMAHQGRPVQDKYFMVMHVRKMFWTEDGWPVVSPERYAAVEQTDIAASDLTGDWERIVFNYNVVPGYADEQKFPNLQSSEIITLDEGGTINGDESNSWEYTAPWLTLSFNDGSETDKVYVEQGRDWENKIASTLIFSGLNQEGTAIWGKKIEQQ